VFAIGTSVLYSDPNQDPSYLIMYYSVKVVFFYGMDRKEGYSATHCNAMQ